MFKLPSPLPDLPPKLEDAVKIPAENIADNIKDSVSNTILNIVDIVLNDVPGYIDKVKNVKSAIDSFLTGINNPATLKTILDEMTKTRNRFTKLLGNQL